ncbi:amidase [Parasphingorhabdus halotolerans]|uniref:Amidase n=1 Tax=Parasphingorhabdus halotolerans TaxID=2725558 RepID=A0A6H2DMR3_9SPHN|nr:amidase [Parasphingorhabdus halotolerans]QJB69478.1 amidase [Parasphingorhabdus halotolerans]
MINWKDLEEANETLKAFTDFNAHAYFGEGIFEDNTLGVKANIAVEGLPWTAGIGAYRDRIANKDADAVAKLKSAGAAIVGILNMEEAALGAKTDNPFFGATQNPHKIGYTPGGSSGGSGAAVAAGICDIALGSDTMGSVRIPAAYCGIYGLKPTHGAISQDGLEIAEASLDSIGPLARSMESLEACSRVLIDFNVPRTIDNIILLKNLGDVECEEAVLKGYEKAKHLMDASTEFSLPYPLTRIRYAGFILTSLALSESLKETVETNPTGVSDSLKFLLTFGPERSEDDLAEDRKILAETRDAVIEAVGKSGAILLPTTPQAAFSHEDKAPANQADFTCLANIAGLPAITIPSGLNEDGLPVAVQIVGAAGNEGGLFALARKLDNQLFAYRQPEFFMKQF